MAARWRTCADGCAPGLPKSLMNGSARNDPVSCVDLSANWRGLLRSFGVGHLGGGSECRNPIEGALVEVLQWLRSILRSGDSVVASPAPVSLRGRVTTLSVDSRWTDAFGRCITGWHRSTCRTCSDQAKRHGTARRGTTQHDRSWSRNA